MNRKFLNAEQLYQALYKLREQGVVLSSLDVAVEYVGADSREHTIFPDTVTVEYTQLVLK